MGGAAGELKAMAERRELEQIEPNVERALRLLEDAEQSLKTARSIVATDPKSALLLAWDGVVFPTLAAALAIAGYRVTHQMGHHRVAVEAARHLLSADALLSRISALRRMRDRGMYESEAAEKEEIAAALDDSQALIHIVSGGEGSQERMKNSSSRTTIEECGVQIVLRRQFCSFTLDRFSALHSALFGARTIAPAIGETD